MANKEKRGALEDVIDRLDAVSAKLDTLIGLVKLAHLEDIEETMEKALESKARRKVYEACDGAKTVEEIAEEVETPQRLVVYHLSTLEMRGLVFHREKNGVKYYHRTLE